MPNHCFSSVSISGEKETIDEMAAFLSKPYKDIDNGGLNFLNLIAPPDEAWTAYNKGDLSPEEMRNNPVNWYDWNNRHWNTKWNAYDVEVRIDEIKDGRYHLHINFTTAWSPAMPVVFKLADLCIEKNLDFTFEWEEEQGFGEEWELKDNQFTMIREWDIPDSHAEYEKQGKDCVCTWEPDPEYHFADCPKVPAEA